MARGLIFFTFLILAFTIQASDIRLSLLDNDAVLNQTGELLSRNGSSAESVAAFKIAVKFHKNDLFDRSRFPKPISGFYAFKSVAELNDSIPDPFCVKVTTNSIDHNSLVCLDVVVLLVKDAGAKAPRLRENFASKCFAKYQNRGTEERPDYAINAIFSFDFYKDGRTLLYPTNGYTYITGLTRTTAEEDLAVSLKGERLIPGNYEDTDQAVTNLFATWNALRVRDELAFPQKIKIVTCGYVPTRYHYWAIDHVAVCVEEDKRLVYLEKNGPRGPFMRVEFNNEKELAEFVANKLLPSSRDPKEINYRSPVFVAVNDRLVLVARP